MNGRSGVKVFSVAGRGFGRGDRELAKVERFAEVAGAQLEKFGDSAAGIVQRFLKIRRSRPGLTAAEYLGAGAVARFADGPAGAPPSRARLVAVLRAVMPGIEVHTLDALTDGQLADLIKNLPSPAPLV